jgi:hypothetical protein
MGREIDKLRGLEKIYCRITNNRLSQLISSTKSGDVVFSRIARQVKAVVFSND